MNILIPRIDILLFGELLYDNEFYVIIQQNMYLQIITKLLLSSVIIDGYADTKMNYMYEMNLSYDYLYVRTRCWKLLVTNMINDK